MDIPLDNSQVVFLKSNIYETLGIDKSLSSFKSFEYGLFAVKPSFVDPQHPKMVDYSLTMPP